MQYKDYANVQIMEHPLIKHKISLMRSIETGNYEFRKLVEEVATLEAYEALRDLPLKQVEIETPLEKTMTPMIDGKKLAIVPILTRCSQPAVPPSPRSTPSRNTAESTSSSCASSLLLTVLKDLQKLIPTSRSMSEMSTENLMKTHIFSPVWEMQATVSSVPSN